MSLDSVSSLMYETANAPPGSRKPPSPSPAQTPFAHVLAHKTTPAETTSNRAATKNSSETKTDKRDTQEKKEGDEDNDASPPDNTSAQTPPTIIAALTPSTTIFPKKQEAMDIGPVPPTLLTEAVGAPAGDELLPQTTTQTDPAQAAGAAASSALLETAGGVLALPGTSLPAAGSASANTMPALPLPAEQTALQAVPKPANNTGMSGKLTLPKTAKADTTQADLGIADIAEGLPAGRLLNPVRLTVNDLHSESDASSDDSASEDGAEALEDRLAASVLQTAGPTADTAQAAPVSPAPIDRTALVQQVKDNLQALHGQVGAAGHGTMTLQLYPQDWGKLQVQVTVNPPVPGQTGTHVTAHLIAESADIKSALESSTGDLRRTLHAAGLNLERVTVSVQTVQAGTDAQGLSGDPGGANSQGGQRSADAWTDAQRASFGTTLQNGQTMSGHSSGRQQQTHSGTRFDTQGVTALETDETTPALATRGYSGGLDMRA